MSSTDYDRLVDQLEEVTRERDAFRALLEQARTWILDVGNDFPGSSCQKWCAEKADQIAFVLEGDDE